ncbi:MAG: lipid-A-disaccharide synthase [Bacteroidetes bacterium]|nr:lipid-A-disaccharide synthase [Bacteroidota bacterium]MCZ2132777.1 lipid-A-disaccharide synthase [Bacteroidota bacterium]
MKFLIVAGDPSGSIHAARLMREILVLAPDSSFYGIGGDDMIEAGLLPLAHTRDVGVVGFWEVAKRYFFFKRLLQTVADSIAEERPDAFIAVDYPGFNLRLAAEAKKAGIPVLYYIAPQLWAWGKNRAAELSRNVDLLLTVFPFETDFFSKLGIHSEFTGHPLLDGEAFRSTEGNGWNKRLIALLPGSRPQEVIRNLPIMLESATVFSERHPNFIFSIAKAPNIPRKIYEDIIRKFTLKKGLNIEFSDDSRLLLEAAYAGLVKTGTSTLEACLCNMPFAMMYRASLFSYYFGKIAVNTKFLAMPNILASKIIVREFIQEDATAANLADELTRLTFDEKTRHIQQDDFADIRRQLGGSGASRRAAGKILFYLQNAAKNNGA